MNLRQQLFSEKELAALAKKFREQSGKNKSEVARELGVHRATVSAAEERPELSLTKLRLRIIETYSSFKVEGPLYLLTKRST